MTGRSVPSSQCARRMSAIATGLAGAGLAAAVHDTRGVLDVTATLDQPGAKATEVLIDEDGYVEIRYWNHTDATPEQVTAIITSALSAITATQRP
jgi:predicted transcriptional regulator